MEFAEAVRRRHMTRSFTEAPIETGLLDRIVGWSLRSPTAGNTKGVAWVLLEGPDQVPLYWDLATTEEWRRASTRFAGLSRAPAIALSITSPAAYVERYGEPDKAASGLGPSPAGGGTSAWPVPYWFGDAAFATLALLLGASDVGLGACFLGNFRGEDALLRALLVPRSWRLFGAVLLGYPDGADHRSPSLDRDPLPVAERVHRGRWRTGRP